MNINKTSLLNIQRKIATAVSVAMVTVALIAFYAVNLHENAVSQETAKSSTVGLKLGFVDFDSIVKDCEAGKKALETMKSFHGKRQQEITAKESSIVEMEKTYDQQKYTLSSEAREKRLYELEQQKLELKRFLEDSEREMEKLNKKYIEPIRDDVFEYIKKYGQENGYGIIFDKTRSTLIYTHPELDLTAEIVRLYNQAYAAKASK